MFTIQLAGTAAKIATQIPLSVAALTNTGLERAIATGMQNMLVNGFGTLTGTYTLNFSGQVNGTNITITVNIQPLNLLP